MHIDVTNEMTIRMDVVMGVPVADFHQHVAYLSSARWIAVGDFPAYHILDDTALDFCTLVAVEGADCLTVSQDGDLVRDLGDFIELVRNQDRRDALSLELEQEFEKCVAVTLIER